MNYSLAQMVLIASNSDGQDTFWMQMLVLVILVASVGIYSLAKTRANKFKEQQQDYPKYAGATGGLAGGQKAFKGLKGNGAGSFLKTARTKAVVKEAVFDFGSGETAGEKPAKERDLAGGMEMLGRDFLVRNVEKTEGDDKNDVTMRQFSFNELLRRGQLKAANSNALKVYAVNKGNLYSKQMQCEAMKELAERTKVRSG